MSQVVRSLLMAAALLVDASPSFPDSVPAPGTTQLPRLMVSTFEPQNDPESGGVLLFVCGVGVDLKVSAIKTNECWLQPYLNTLNCTIN